MATKVASPVAAATAAASTTEGLTFEVRECDDGHLYSPKTPLSPTSPVSPLNPEDCEGVTLTRSESTSLTDPPATAPEAPKDPNISRIQVGDNAATQAVLHFLTSQGINTTKFVTEHMMRYGSRIRVAMTDDGKIVGCLIFDNEADVAELLTMTPEEWRRSWSVLSKTARLQLCAQMPTTKRASTCTGRVASSRCPTWVFRPTHQSRATWKFSHSRRWGSRERRSCSRGSTNWGQGSNAAGS